MITATACSRNPATNTDTVISFNLSEEVVDLGQFSADDSGQTFIINAINDTASDLVGPAVLADDTNFTISLQRGNCDDLSIGKKCTFVLYFNPRGKAVAEYSAQVNIGTAVLNFTTSVIAAEVNNTPLVFSQSELNFGELSNPQIQNNYIKTITVRNTSDRAKEFNFTPVSQQGISVSSNCPSTLQRGKVCRIVVTISLRDLSAGESNTAIEINGVPLNVSVVKAPNPEDVFIPTFSAYTPAQEDTIACSGVVPTSRTIIACENGDGVSQNVSFCSDPNPTSTVLSKAGEVVSSIENGSVTKTCGIGDSVGVDVVSCNAQFEPHPTELACQAVPNIYTATFSAYTPAQEDTVACSGVVPTSRTIIACENQFGVPQDLSSCSDPNPTSTVLSKQGTVITPISNGSVSKTCDIGQTTASSEFVSCDQGFNPAPGPVFACQPDDTNSLYSPNMDLASGVYTPLYEKPNNFSSKIKMIGDEAFFLEQGTFVNDPSCGGYVSINTIFRFDGISANSLTTDPSSLIPINMNLPEDAEVCSQKLSYEVIEDRIVLSVMRGFKIEGVLYSQKDLFMINTQTNSVFDQGRPDYYYEFFEYKNEVYATKYNESSMAYYKLEKSGMDIVETRITPNLPYSYEGVQDYVISAQDNRLLFIKSIAESLDPVTYMTTYTIQTVIYNPDVATSGISGSTFGTCASGANPCILNFTYNTNDYPGGDGYFTYQNNIYIVYKTKLNATTQRTYITRVVESTLAITTKEIANDRYDTGGYQYTDGTSVFGLYLNKASGYFYLPYSLSSETTGTAATTNRNSGLSYLKYNLSGFNTFAARPGIQSTSTTGIQLCSASVTYNGCLIRKGTTAVTGNEIGVGSAPIFTYYNNKLNLKVNNPGLENAIYSFSEATGTITAKTTVPLTSGTLLYDFRGLNQAGEIIYSTNRGVAFLTPSGANFTSREFTVPLNGFAFTSYRTMIGEHYFFHQSKSQAPSKYGFGVVKNP